MVSILCPKCKEHYKAEYSTIKIYGPVVHIECPFCKHESYRGFSKFAELQIKKGDGLGRFDLVHDMIEFSRKLEGEIFDG